jgi:hypothetical protein
MKINNRDLIFIIGDISEYLYQITKLTDKEKKYSKEEIQEIYQKFLIIDQKVDNVKTELAKLSKRL